MWRFLGVLLALTICQSVIADQIPMVNAGFEQPVTSSYAVNPTLPGWTYNGSPLGASTWLGVQIGSYVGVREGNQVFWANMNATNPNYRSFTLRQTIDANTNPVIAGNSYVVSFSVMSQWPLPWQGTANLKFGSNVVSTWTKQYSGATQWETVQLPLYTALAPDNGTVITIEFTGQLLPETTSGQAQMCLDAFALNVVDISLHASNPLPADQAVGTGLPTKLSWTAAAQDGPYMHHVYFGTDPNNLPLAYTGTTAEYTLPLLAYNTKYYWRVDEVNGSTTRTGYLWSFDTGSAVCNPAIAGDVNNDCVLDFADLRIVAQNWLDCNRVNGACP